ncbi:MAG: polynucleotide adenylyltransferase PcnB [Myxococcales bacterium]|nr:polynucleotide adenylyltransferase PcnB [Myxococcales bacterium]
MGSNSPRREPAPPDFIERVDEDAQKVLRRLNQFDYHGFLVGGGVRDLLLGGTPKDFDVATSARPQEVRKLFRNCRLIGRRFRLAHILFTGGKVIETATFRAKPAEVNRDGALITDDNEFGTPESDAHRRDFTVNALFYDYADDVVLDYVGGLDDLEKRLLRTIGDPVVRFKEDPVRILRAVKFAARLDFDFEPATKAAMLSERFDLEKAAIPRLLEEIYRMLKGGAAAQSFKLLDELALMELLIPEVSAFLGRPADDPWHPLIPILQALDAAILAGEDICNGVMLATFFWPLYQAALASLPSKPTVRELRPVAEAIVGPMAVRLKMPKRDVAILLAVLEGQLRFEHARRRRATRAAFGRHPNFGPTWRFYQLRAAAEGEPEERIAEWAELAEEFPQGGDDDRRRPRRRRRER